MKFLTLVVFLFLSASAEKARFDNYRVYSVKIENHQQLEAMKYLEEHSDSVNRNFCGFFGEILHEIFQSLFQYDFFETAHLHAEAEILVPPHKFADFDEVTENFGMQKTLLINNYQE